VQAADGLASGLCFGEAVAAFSGLLLRIRRRAFHELVDLAFEQLAYVGGEGPGRGGRGLAAQELIDRRCDGLSVGDGPHG